MWPWCSYFWFETHLHRVISCSCLFPAWWPFVSFSNLEKALFVSLRAAPNSSFAKRRVCVTMNESFYRWVNKKCNVFLNKATVGAFAKRFLSPPSTLGFQQVWLKLCVTLWRSLFQWISEWNDVLHLHFAVLDIYKTFGQENLSEKLTVKSSFLCVAGAYSCVGPITRGCWPFI